MLVPVGGVLVAHYYIQPPRRSTSASSPRCTSAVGGSPAYRSAGVAAWAAGAAAFFAAGSIGGTLPALAVSVLVYRALLYTRRDETVA